MGSFFRVPYVQTKPFVGDTMFQFAKNRCDNHDNDDGSIGSSLSAAGHGWKSINPQFFHNWLVVSPCFNCDLCFIHFYTDFVATTDFHIWSMFHTFPCQRFQHLSTVIYGSIWFLILDWNMLKPPIDGFKHVSNCSTGRRLTDWNRVFLAWGSLPPLPRRGLKCSVSDVETEHQLLWIPLGPICAYKII